MLRRDTLYPADSRGLADLLAVGSSLGVGGKLQGGTGGFWGRGSSWRPMGLGLGGGKLEVAGADRVTTRGLQLTSRQQVRSLNLCLPD